MTTPPEIDFQNLDLDEMALKSENWPFVENCSFERKDEEWPPPSCIKDQLSGEFEIYYKDFSMREYLHKKYNKVIK